MVERKRKRVQTTAGEERTEVEETENAPGVTVASLRSFRAALIGPTQGLPKRRLTLPLEKTEILRVRNVIDAIYAFGCMVAIRRVYRMARDWHYHTKLSLSSALLPFSALCYYSFLFVVFVLFLFCL